MTEQLTHRPYNLGWPSVGREQISQDGMFRLSHPTFCKYWLCNSWDHYTLQMHLTRYSLGHKILWVARIYELHQKAAAFYHCIRAVSIGSAMRGENIVCLLLWLLCQPGQRTGQFKYKEIVLDLQTFKEYCWHNRGRIKEHRKKGENAQNTRKLKEKKNHKKNLRKK